MKRIWISHSRGEDEGTWFDIEVLRSPGVLRLLDVIAISSSVLLVLSAIWLYGGAKTFLDSIEKMTESPKGAEGNGLGETVFEDYGRWPFEAKLLFDTCTPLNESWIMPENMKEQDELFWYPGELQCVWEYQGVGDRAAIAIRNVLQTDLALRVNISSDAIGFNEPGDEFVTVPANESEVVGIEIVSEDFDEFVYVKIEAEDTAHAYITLKIQMIADSTQRNSHTYEGQSLNVHYKVWIYDTGELLDEGDLPVTAGEDPNYIKGFGWGCLGLDYDFADRGLLGSGTTHTVLLPPDLAYKNRDDRPEANNEWLLFELSLNYATV